MKKRTVSIAFTIISAMVVAVYLPGLSGSFLFDDAPNIVNNPDLRIETLSGSQLRDAALSGHAGALGRPVSMLSFGLNYYISGYNPFAFKLTNVLIHMLSATGLLVLTAALLRTWRQITRVSLTDRQIAYGSIFVAATWALHPLNLSTVLYVVQRMTELSALFSIWAMVFYVRGRALLLENRRGGWSWIIAAFVVFTPLATFSKENGALIPLYALIIESVVFRFQSAREDRRLLLALFAFTVGLPMIAGLGFLSMHPSWLESRYALRDFSLEERLLTEARALWYYIYMTFVPDPRNLSLYHDTWTLSRGFFEPRTTAFAIVGLSAALAGALLWRTRFPIAATGVLLFLSGHLLESSVIPLELVFEHRNYLPMYGLLLVLLQAGLGIRGSRTVEIRRYLAVAVICLLGLTTAVRADYWGDPLRHAVMELSHKPNSARANHQAASMYERVARHMEDGDLREELLEKAEDLYLRASKLDSGFTGGLFSLISLQSRNSGAIDDAVVRKLLDRLKSTPMRSSSVNHLRHLIDCHAQHQCQIEPDTLEAIINATLANQSLTGRARAMTLVAAANYLARAGNTEQSLKLVYQALELDPNNIPLRLNLTDALSAIGEVGLASQQIELATRHDKWNVYANEIEARRAKIQNGSH